MENFIGQLLAAAMSGGPQAIIAILMVVIIILFLERRRLVKDIERKDQKIEKIIDEYYKGNITLAQALNSLKVVLFEIKSKL